MSEDFLKSVEADRRIFYADILVDKAHVVMLAEQHIIEGHVAGAILSALGDLERRGEEFLDNVLPLYEDVHTAIEATLIKELGEDIGGRMHTARSRNDEVATCIRIVLREDILKLGSALNSLRRVLLSRASEETETIMPGYTHLQHAQPTTLSHHLIAHFDAFSRDFERLEDAFKRTNRSPLGAAALAGTGFDVNRERTAELLGFYDIVENTMDSVSARDFIIEAIACCSNIMVNLSRLAEELILWSTSEFSFADIMATGSSIMPQKRNPDYAELVRAKACTVFGCMTAVLSMLKALPLSYNRDMQEATPHLFNAFQATLSSVEVMRDMIAGAHFNRERMREEAEKGEMFATELADMLVRNHGFAFRKAHRIVSSTIAEICASAPDTLQARRDALKNRLKSKLSGIGLSDDEIDEAMDIRANIKRRKTAGGPANVEQAIEKRWEILKKDETLISRKEEKLRESLENLERETEKWIRKL